MSRCVWLEVPKRVVAPISSMGQILDREVLGKVYHRGQLQAVIQYSKLADERRDAGTMECWCLHGAVGMAADWRNFAKAMVGRGVGSRAVDLWR
ncbi:MAG: hypothetical protein ORN51_05030, partial [Akkermansiaceae bacterium]|nr:hypothetical protein [Akkermansiaceae bacterium]